MWILELSILVAMKVISATERFVSKVIAGDEAFNRTSISGF